MGRHTVINPKTGRRVLKTGAIGRKLVSKARSSKDRSSKPMKKKDVSHKKKVLSKLYPKAAKTQRPSARVMYDWGYKDPVFYNGKWHEMAFRTNGSPYWKPIK